jgi:hypothetical protein
MHRSTRIWGALLALVLVIAGAIPVQAGTPVDHAAALAASDEEGKPILLDFFTEW